MTLARSIALLSLAFAACGDDNDKTGEVAPDGEVTVHSVFHVDLFEPRQRAVQVSFGHYAHRLRAVDGRWLIAGKTIVLMNDVIPTMIDVYSV